jgi:hypothetical protein
VDLTLVMAVMNAWNRMAISFRHGPVARRELGPLLPERRLFGHLLPHLLHQVVV